MPRRPRKEIETKYYHIMTQGIRQEYIFNNDKFKKKYIHELKKYLEKQMYTCINYIYNNPVKAGICDIRDKYLYSNYSEFIKNNKIMAKEIEENGDEYNEVWS